VNSHSRQTVIGKTTLGKMAVGESTFSGVINNHFSKKKTKKLSLETFLKLMENNFKSIRLI